MAQDPCIPEEIAADLAAVEQEANAAIGVVAPKRGPGRPKGSKSKPATPQPTAVVFPALPLSDLRERVQMLREAGVTHYEDGPLKILIEPRAAAPRQPSKDEIF